MNQPNNTRETAVMPALPAAGVGSEATRVEQARAVAEVAAAVQVAQMYPRDQRNAWLAMQDACSRKGLAERAFYTVPNRGHGPSVHLARELARIWGNMDYGVRETHRDDDLGRSEVLAFAWDQQTNSRTSRSFLVPHVRMAKGKRNPLTDVADIYLNNQNQGARALRECIFAIMPADFVSEAQEICRETLVKGDGKPLQQRITSIVAAFAELGVDVPRIEQKIGRSRGQWTPADVADLTILGGTLRRNETTVDEAFPPVLTLDLVEASSPGRLNAAPGSYSPGQTQTPATAPGQSPPMVPGLSAEEGLAYRAAERKGNSGPGQPRPPSMADVPFADQMQRAGLIPPDAQPLSPVQPPRECGAETPDGPCNLTAGHKTGPEEPGFDGHDVIPTGAPTE